MLHSLSLYLTQYIEYIYVSDIGLLSFNDNAKGMCYQLELELELESVYQKKCKYETMWQNSI